MMMSARIAGSSHRRLELSSGGGGGGVVVVVAIALPSSRMYATSIDWSSKLSA
jgi:hypothetical protein